MLERTGVFYKNDVHRKAIGVMPQMKYSAEVESVWQVNGWTGGLSDLCLC